MHKANESMYMITIMDSNYREDPIASLSAMTKSRESDTLFGNSLSETSPVRCLSFNKVFSTTPMTQRLLC